MIWMVDHEKQPLKQLCNWTTFVGNVWMKSHWALGESQYKDSSNCLFIHLFLYLFSPAQEQV